MRLRLLRIGHHWGRCTRDAILSSRQITKSPSNNPIANHHIAKSATHHPITYHPIYNRLSSC